MANELKNLVLTELSLVDRPANPLAMAPIFKRDSNGEDMTEEVQNDVEQETKRPAYKALYEEAQAKAEELAAEIETLKADKEALEKAAVEKAEPVEYLEVEGEQIAKSDIPTPILKALETAAFEKRQVELEKRAKEELPNFALDVAKGLLDQITDEDLLKALKAADAAMAGLMDEIGKTDETADFNTAQEKLDAAVIKFAKENSVPVEKATAEVMKTEEGRALAIEAMKERK